MDYRALGHSGVKVHAPGFGAGNEQQLRDNLGAIEQAFDARQTTRIDVASAVMPPYPCYPNWNGMFAEHNPPPVPFTVPTESPA